MLSTLYKFLQEAQTPDVSKVAYMPVNNKNNTTVCFRINNDFYFADRDEECDIFSVRLLNADKYLLTVIGANDIYYARIQSDDSLVLTEIRKLVHIINEYIILATL